MGISVSLIWFLVGLVFIGLEFLAPGVIIIFFGAGAWVTAIASWLFPSLTLTGQLIVFLVSAILSLVLLRGTIAKRFYQNTDKSDSDLDNDFVGKDGEVIQPITSEEDGVVLFRGTTWTARAAEPIEAGSRVVIVKKDGLTLVVARK